MGDRVTRLPQSRELVRAKRLRQALERGAPPAFVPPAAPNPVAQPSSLSWSSGEKSSAEKAPAENSKKTNSREKDSKNTSSRKLIPPPVSRTALSKFTRPSHHHRPSPSARCASIRNFSVCSAIPPAQILGKSIDQLIFPPDRAAEADWIAQCLQRGEHLTLETQRRCERRHPARCFRLLRSLHHRRPDRRLLRRLSRHLRAQARRSSQLRSLSHRRKSQRHSGSAAVLRRHPRHRR